MPLKETFENLVLNFTADKTVLLDYWTEVINHYNGPKRHYHNLKHLENLHKQLQEVRDKIKEWDATLFSLFYHDIIYNALKSTNEEKSALVAVERMTSIGVDPTKIAACKDTIIATKTHLLSENSDTNYFTDADLSILGQDWDTYQTYTKQVRKEYAIYPSLIYNPGRKKVVKHFLAMNQIFKTDYFFNKFEMKAKENLEQELASF